MRNDNYCPICDHHHCICSEHNPEISLLNGVCEECDKDPATCISNNSCIFYEEKGDVSE